MVVKLTYFPMTGLGEPIRLILAFSKTEFEDRRVHKEEWQAMKKNQKLPFLPSLEIDGKTFFQSVAISRYLAKKAGLCGSSDDDALNIDMTVDTLEDLRKGVISHYYKPDSKERDEGMKKALAETIPFFLKLLEQQLAENNGYLVGGKVSWADIWFFSHTDYISSLYKEDILANFPTLKDLQQKISELPGIKEWVAKRPPAPNDHRVFFL